MSAGHERLQCDPVCGRELTEEQALLSAEVNGDRSLFCSKRCRMASSGRTREWKPRKDGVRP